VLINALFHNASFLTFNSDTLIMLFFYASASAARVSVSSAGRLPILRHEITA
jgi:hypothetical protein